jgi:hypothetical protein
VPAAKLGFFLAGGGIQLSITLYPTRIEAVDEDGDVVFHLETFDEHTCRLEMHGLISPNNLLDVMEAISRGITLLELEGVDRG